MKRVGGHDTINNMRDLRELMAKKNRVMKTEPAVMKLRFATTVVAGNGGTGRFYVDLSQAASILNRRFYRQGLRWGVGSIKILSLITNGSVTVRKAMNTWVVGGAWNKTMRKWLEQQNHALEQAGAQSATAAFRDYKVFLDDEHVTDYVAAGNDLNATNLVPIDGAGNPFLPGEWEASQVVIPNDGAPGTTNEYLVKMHGASDANAKSALGGYVFSRARPFTPDPAAPQIETSWLSTMQDVGDNQSEVVDNATDKNDNLPYDATSYPGQGSNGPTSYVHDTAFISGTTVGGQSYLRGGEFPCGLMRFDVSNSDASAKNIVIEIDLIPGPHRGYLAESMTEM